MDALGVLGAQIARGVWAPSGTSIASGACGYAYLCSKLWFQKIHSDNEDKHNTNLVLEQFEPTSKKETASSGKEAAAERKQSGSCRKVTGGRKEPATSSMSLTGLAHGR